MLELGKYFHIYCHTTHKKWPELVPYVQDWLNSLVVETTGYAPVELFNGEPKLDIFRNVLKKRTDQLPIEDTLANKVLKAYVRSKLKAKKRNEKYKTGETKLYPKLGDLVLVKKRIKSGAARGFIEKFQRPFEGPYTIQKGINSALFELKDEKGKLIGLYNL
jgi:hypothetical protein